MNLLAGRASLAWRVPTWLVIVGVTVLGAPDPAPRLVAGIAMAAAVVALQFTDADSLAVRRIVVAIGVAGGLTACFAAHDGLGEIPVFVAAARFPEVADGRTLHVITATAAVAFGATVVFISRSWVGLLAGVGVPLLVQRSVERRDLVHERDRAQALLAEVQAGREAEAQAAALQERGRIAREMHDVLAHSLAGLSVQLQATRAVAAREGVGPEVLDPLDRAADLAREGLTEARAAVSALRDPIGLGLAELPALVERHPGSATLTVTGTPAAVDPEAGHALYRAVQEALTNAARYAPGSPVGVELAWSPERLVVTVTDDGPGPDRAVASSGTGLGLAGMDERLRAAGGAVTAGPRDRRGWRVEASVPTQPVAGAAS